MRRTFFWLGWVVLLILPLLFTIEIVLSQDLPRVAIWQWAIPVAAVLMIYLARDRDDVLKHHLL